MNPGGIIDADCALAEARLWRTGAVKRVPAHHVLGVVGEGGESFGLELGAIDESEKAVAARSHDPHQLEGQAAHGVARIDLHHGLEPGALRLLAVRSDPLSYETKMPAEDSRQAVSDS